MYFTFYTIFEFRLTTFQRLNRFMWLVATVLGSLDNQLANLVGWDTPREGKQRMGHRGCQWSTD